MPVSGFEPRISNVRSDRSTKSDITCSNRLLLYRMDVVKLDYYKLGYLKVLRDELNSVTRFDEISTLWQKKVFGEFFWIAYLVFGKLLYQLWNFYATGQIFIVVNGQILNKNMAIWSHWSWIAKEVLRFDSRWQKKFFSVEKEGSNRAKNLREISKAF